jgi:voltage-gated potassium channel
MVFNPHSQAKIEGGDTLIVLGEPGSISKLEDLVDRTSTDAVIQKHRKDQANAL